MYRFHRAFLVSGLLILAVLGSGPRKETKQRRATTSRKQQRTPSRCSTSDGKQEPEDGGRLVEFRNVGHLGQVLKSDKRTVRCERETIRQHMGRLTGRITVFKHNEQFGDERLAQVQNLDASVFTEIAGYDQPRIDFVTESTIPFRDSNGSRACKMALSSGHQIVPADLFRQCAQQLNIPADPSQWTYNTRSLAETEEEQDIVDGSFYMGGSLTLLEFVQRGTAGQQQPAGVRAPSRRAATGGRQEPRGANANDHNCVNITGLQYGGTEILVTVKVSHVRMYVDERTSCRVPVDLSLTDKRLEELCEQSMPWKYPTALSLVKRDGREHKVPAGSTLIREWCHNPGLELTGNSLIQ